MFQSILRRLYELDSEIIEELIAWSWKRSTLQISWKVKLLMCFEPQILNVVIFNIFKSVETVRPAGLNEYCLHEERPGPLWASI